MAINAKSKLIDAEDAATGAVGIGVYIAYFKSIGLVLGITAVTCNALMQTASVYSGSNYLSSSSRSCNLTQLTFSFILVWLTDWSSDPRASDPDDYTWRNIYMGVFGGLGVAQGM